MTAILKYLLAQMVFLFKGNRFRFVDSQTSSSFGGDAFVILQSQALRLRLINDRGQLFLDFQSVERGGEDWFSIDVVLTILTNERPDSAELDEKYAVFLRKHLDEIEHRFRAAEIAKTEKGFPSSRAREEPAPVWLRRLRPDEGSGDRPLCSRRMVVSRVKDRLEPDMVENHIRFDSVTTSISSRTMGLGSRGSVFGSRHRAAKAVASAAIHGKLKSIETTNRGGTSLERHSLSYLDGTIYVIGHRTRDETFLKGPSGSPTGCEPSCTQ